MIRLTPDLTYPTQCPRCRGVGWGTIRFTGPVTLAQTNCPVCWLAYSQTLPTGQFNRFPVTVSADGPYNRVAERGKWLLPLVGRCAVPAGSAETPIQRVGEPVADGADVTLLLCLDSCYGHALMMLFNAQRHHEQHPNRAIIAVVPRALVWLVPDYVAETWVIEQPLLVLTGPVPGFAEWVRQQVARFSTVWLSAARIHFDHRTTRFSDFTRTRRFDLNQFDRLTGFNRELPRLTLVLREDRLWLRHSWERWLHKALTRLGMETRTRPVWARWQVNRYRKLSTLLYEKGLLTSTVAVGITGGGQYPIDLGCAIHDERRPAPLSPDQERTWCRQYARSHVVVGVHGSGMLLPTSLAAGFVCLMPPDKLAHYAEDVLMAHENPIHQTLLGRFLPTSSSPRQVADLIASMLTEFPVWLAEAQERDGERVGSAGDDG